MESPRVRPASANDAGILAALAARTFEEAFGQDNTPDNVAAYLANNFTVAQLGKELAEPLIRFYLADLDTAAVGYFKLQWSEPPPCVGGVRPVELSRIYVLAKWLGRGIGQAPLQCGLDEARLAGAETLWLGVWERNERAIAFYRKWGSSRCGEQSFTLGEDLQTDWIMSRPL